MQRSLLVAGVLAVVAVVAWLGTRRPAVSPTPSPAAAAHRREVPGGPESAAAPTGPAPEAAAVRGSPPVAEPGRRVQGTVVRDGRPVAGAEVRTGCGCSPSTRRTDADGRFALDQLEPACTTIVASSGSDGGFAHVAQGALKVEGLVIALRPGGTVAGDVKDEAGEPVAGARVWVGTVPPDARPDASSCVRVDATTGADGSFQISGVPPDQYWAWSVPPPGFVKPSGRPIEVRRDEPARLQFRLLRAGRLAGLVVDGTGAPIGDARISAHRVRESQPLATDWDAQDWAGARSDRRGRFSLDGAPPGRLELSVMVNGFLAAELEVTAPGDVTVRLARGGTLEVTVLDENGLALPGASVIAVHTAQPGRADLFPFRYQADARGRCRLTGLASGRYRVLAQVGQGTDPPVFVARTVATDATVDAPGTTAVELRFAPGRAISGRVIDEVTGRALAGVHVVAGDEERDAPFPGVLDGDDRSPGAGGEAVSDDRGRFEISGLRPNPHALLWERDGYYMAVETSPRVRPGEADVLLKMKPRPKLTGRALDEAGNPIADLLVNGRPCHAADGRFALPRDPQATRTIVDVESEGFAPFRREVTCEPDRDLDLGDIRLSRGRTLRVTVLSATTGQAVPSARVAAAVPGGESVEVGRTGADGTATLRNLPAAIEVVVSDEMFLRTRVAVPDDAQEVTVRVGAGGTIEATVRNAAGQPIRNLLISADKLGNSSESRLDRTDQEGRFVFRGLPAGDYVVQLLGDRAGGNAGLSPRHVQLAAGETARVDLVESKGVTLSLSNPHDHCRVRVVAGALTLDRATLEEAELHSLDSSLSLLGLDRTFLFHGLAPGPYTAVCATDPDRAGTRRASLMHVDIGASDVAATLPEPTTPVP